jgi:hypothetical protein
MFDYSLEHLFSYEVSLERHQMRFIRRKRTLS